MKNYFYIILCLVLLGSVTMGCDSKSEEIALPEEENAVVEETADNGTGVLLEGENTYELDWGWLEDWGLEYPGSRSYAIDLFSSDFKSYEREGVKVGIYFNSPSLSSFEEGTYIFKDPEHAPGGILFASISIGKTGARLANGYIKVERDGDIYTITFEVVGIDVDTDEERTFSGSFVGPLPLD